MDALHEETAAALKQACDVALDDETLGKLIA